MTGVFPLDWKVAKVMSIHKSEPFSNFDNYWPISILPVLFMIIEKIIHRRVMSFLNKNHLLSQSQFAFRPNFSTEYAATILLDDIRKNVDKGNLFGAIFVDLTKAFDTLSHGTLFEKLSQYGIKGNRLEWFKDNLFCRKSVVSYNGCLSKDHNVFSGVPQGSILGPLLFLVYFNDAIEAIEHSSIIKYADDTVLYIAGKDIQSIQTKLLKGMDSLADWLGENELIINLKKGKTVCLLFGTAQRIAKHSKPLKVFISSPSPTVIVTTKVYKYLGIYVDSLLNLNSNFDRCYKRGTGRLRLYGPSGS